MERERHGYLTSSLKLFFGLIVILVFIWSFNPETISLIQQQITKTNIFFVCLFIFLSTVPTLLRWIFLVTSNNLKVNTKSVIISYYSGFLLNSVSPANIGGDIYRAFAIQNSNNKYPTIINALLHERIYGLINLLILVALLSILFPSPNFYMSQENSQIIMGLLLLIICGFLFFKKALTIRLKKFKTFKFLSKYLNFDNTSYQYDFYVLLLSCLGFLCWALAIFLVCQELNMHLTYMNILIISAIVEIIRMVPLTFQGIGVREPSFAFIASEFFGSNFEVAFFGGLIIYACLSIINLTLGAIFYFQLNFKD